MQQMHSLYAAGAALFSKDGVRVMREREAALRKLIES